MKSDVWWGRGEQQTKGGEREKEEKKTKICLDDKKETKSTKVSRTRGPHRHENMYYSIIQQQRHIQKNISSQSETYSGSRCVNA